MSRESVRNSPGGHSNCPRGELPCDHPRGYRRRRLSCYPNAGGPLGAYAGGTTREFSIQARRDAWRVARMCRTGVGVRHGVAAAARSAPRLPDPTANPASQDAYAPSAHLQGNN